MNNQLEHLEEETIFFTRHLLTELMDQSSQVPAPFSWNDISSRDEWIFIPGGGFATVYLVVDKQSNQKRALKVLNKQEMRRRRQWDHIQNEMNILGSLNSPFVVKLFRIVEDQNYYYLFMEYIPGGELMDLMIATTTKNMRAKKKERGLSSIEARFYASEILLALKYLHSQSIMHRDIKAENIMLTENGHIKLIDFGFSLQQPKAYSILGSLQYNAPEVFQRNSTAGYDRKVDTYAFGVLLYLLRAGKYPYDREDDNQEGIIHMILNVPLTVPDYFEEKLKDLLKILLAKNPDERPEVEQVMLHPWFEYVPWPELNEGKIANAEELNACINGARELIEAKQIICEQPFPSFCF